MIERFLHRSRTLYHSSLQARFLLRVLLPPFLILLVVSVVGYALLSISVRQTETANLQRAASTTAAKLDREFALRKTILRSTGKELFSMKSDYAQQRTILDSDYLACRNFIKTSERYVSAPGDVCRSFFAQFAIASQNGVSLVKAVDTGYSTEANEIASLEQSTVNERLKAFVEFFPETSQLLVINSKREVISKAVSGDAGSAEFTKTIKEISESALEKSAEGVVVKDGKVRRAVFAYPIDQGAVLAAYDIDNAQFLYPSWKSAPINNSRAYVVVADTKSEEGYPNLDDESLYKPVLGDTKGDGNTGFKSSGISYLATSEPVAQTSWRVIVSSPEAIALESLFNTQILAVVITGVLLVSFLWVGSRFVHRTVGSILGLVGGALIFSSGQLDHKIDQKNMSDKEFSQLAEIMNNMAEKIQAAEVAIDQKNKEFISVATHEIKAPMTVIIGNLSMILDDGMGTVDETARRLADEAYKGTVRLRNLVSELLDIARLESGRATFDLTQIDLNELVTSMVELQAMPAVEKQISLVYEPSNSPFLVMADKTKLEIVLTNFISNGIKYNRPNGTVTISHQVREGMAEIVIQDTGLGIPAEQQAKMFQKFFRVEDADRSGVPGTGLGMFITKQFIDGMAGKLWFESEHGKGTAFHFTLPLANSATIVSDLDPIVK